MYCHTCRIDFGEDEQLFQAHVQNFHPDWTIEVKVDYHLAVTSEQIQNTRYRMVLEPDGLAHFPPTCDHDPDKNGLRLLDGSGRCGPCCYASLAASRKK